MRIIKTIVIFTFAAFFVSCAHNNKNEEKNMDSAKMAENMMKTEKQNDEIMKAKMAEMKQMYTCDVKGDMRVVNLDKTKKRCEVYYTKAGEKSQVAWAESHQNICTEVYNQIRTNIEGGGFKCVDGDINMENRETASQF